MLRRLQQAEARHATAVAAADNLASEVPLAAEELQLVVTGVAPLALT